MNQAPPQSRFAAFVQKFTCLRSAPRELWVILAAYVLENIAYRLSGTGVLPLWLNHDLGFQNARTLTGIWSAGMTVVILFVGPLTDVLGIRKTFLLGFFVCLIARMVMVLTVNRWLVLPFGFCFYAVGIAMMIPVMVAGVKMFSNAAQRSVAFSLYYALMNLGFAIGAKIFDEVRNPNTGLGEYGHWVLPVFHLELSTYRVLLLLSAAATVPGLIAIWAFLREGVEVTETGIEVKPAVAAGRAIPKLADVSAYCRRTMRETAQLFLGLWRQQAFHRFIWFMALIVAVRTLFIHLSMTMPTFGIRELGEGSPIGTASDMLNAVLILILVPIVGALTQRVTSYRMIQIGSLVSSLSVGFLVMPREWFRGLAEGSFGRLLARHLLHLDPAGLNPLYIGIVLFMVFLSVGEALWSPRLYEYSAAIAPKGQEASYMAFSQLPMFLAKILTGLLSDWLLRAYCPEAGPRDTGKMWLFIGCFALITPVGAFLFRKRIQVHEAGRDDGL
jgi:MFS family permease